MKKYNKKLILDYISGNEIIGYDIDELENDSEFMTEVIKYTKDKKMYNLCSDEVKNNYMFIRFMIETFIDDLDFVVSIADKYLENKSINDIVSMELDVLISEHITREQAEDNMHLFLYKTTAAGHYELERSTFSHLIEKVDDEELKEEYGLGFLYYFDKYRTSKILCDFFAKKLLETIFYENSECSLEELFHKNFKTFEQLKNQGINNFLIQHIEQYDSYLSDYISENINLLNIFNKSINRIERNWNNYIARVNEQKVIIYNEELSKYMDSNLSSISMLELTMYSIKKLNIKEIFYKYDPFLKEFSEMMEMDSQELVSDISTRKNLNTNDYKCVMYALNLAKDLFKNDIIENNTNNCQEEVKQKNQNSKVLKVNFKTKNIEQ